MKTIFSPTKLGSLSLSNRLVMAPMTRNRAVVDNAPAAALEAVYYAQRAGAGLIITEGTSPNADGLGYARMPALYTDAQIAGWKAVAEAVHAKGGKVFVQLMHSGRIGVKVNLPAGARLLGPSAIRAAGEIFTEAGGKVPHDEPEAMTAADIEHTVAGFVTAAKNAVEKAGLDGVELHGANGYLLEQFLRPSSNTRTDSYGGDIAGRARFILDVVAATTAAIGVERVGIRLSPFSPFNDVALYDGLADDYVWLAEQLRGRVQYVHIVDHSSMGSTPVPDSVKAAMRKAFGGTFILSGGYDAERAEADVAAGKADLIAVGRPFLANPDLVKRWQLGAALNAVDFSTLYTPGEKGYLDYAELA